MGWEKVGEENPRQAVLFTSDDPEQQKILDQLKNGPELLDLIAIHTGMPVSKKATLLFELEMMGAVRPMAGKNVVWPRAPNASALFLKQGWQFAVRVWRLVSRSSP